MNPVYVLRGRLVMQGIITTHLIAELSDDEDDYFMDALAMGSFAIGTFSIWYPVVKAAAVGWTATVAVEGTAAAAGAVVTAAAPFTAGYLIGATAGTMIANEVWGEEGAQTALGFYSGGLLPGTEAPDLTDYQYIFKPTEPGGPESLYDIAEKGIETTVLTVRKGVSKFAKRSKRWLPSRRRRFWWL